ncbi:MAG: hypothetical protein Q7U16_03770 [Agitococcus sp.]|nr:hypothetical protein [Agitococcus sp.]
MSNLAQRVNALAIQVKSLLNNARITVVDSLSSSSTTAAAAANAVKTLKELLDNFIETVNQPYGVCPLDGSSKVPSANLPSYVDDVLEFDNLAALPITGEAGKIYLTKNTNFIYRWTGSTYLLIGDGTSVDVIGVGSTAFARYDQVSLLNDAAKLQHHENVGTFQPKNINVTEDYVFSALHNNGQTIIRVDSEGTQTATINNLLTKSVTIRRVGTGALSLVDDNVVLNGSLTFNALNQSKTIVYVSAGIYDVYG